MIPRTYSYSLRFPFLLLLTLFLSAPLCPAATVNLAGTTWELEANLSGKAGKFGKFNDKKKDGVTITVVFDPNDDTVTLIDNKDFAMTGTYACDEKGNIELNFDPNELHGYVDSRLDDMGLGAYAGLLTTVLDEKRTKIKAKVKASKKFVTMNVNLNIRVIITFTAPFNDKTYILKIPLKIVAKIKEAVEPSPDTSNGVFGSAWLMPTTLWHWTEGGTIKRIENLILLVGPHPNYGLGYNQIAILDKDKNIIASANAYVTNQTVNFEAYFVLQSILEHFARDIYESPEDHITSFVLWQPNTWDEEDDTYAELPVNSKGKPVLNDKLEYGADIGVQRDYGTEGFSFLGEIKFSTTQAINVN